MDVCVSVLLAFRFVYLCCSCIIVSFHVMHLTINKVLLYFVFLRMCLFIVVDVIIIKVFYPTLEE